MREHLIFSDAELEALRNMSVIIDRHGTAHQASDDSDIRFWQGAGDGSPSRSADINLPALAIWEPEA